MAHQAVADIHQGTGARGIFGGFRARVARLVMGLQYARMVRTLYDLSDSQLAAIGVRREDIPQHACKCLMQDEADRAPVAPEQS